MSEPRKAAGAGHSKPAAGVSPSPPVDTLSHQLAGLSDQFVSAFQQFSELEAQLTARVAKLERRDTKLAKRAASLSERQQDLDRRYQELQAQAEALAAEGERFEQQRQQFAGQQDDLARRRDHLAAREVTLTARERVVAQMDEMLSEMATTFDTGDGASAASSKTDSGDSASRTPESGACEQAGSPPSKLDDRSGSQQKPPQGVDGYPGEDDTVNAADFTEGELEKLHVLQRLGTGESDAELIARIRAERAANPPTGECRETHGSKRRWWK